MATQIHYSVSIDSTTVLILVDRVAGISGPGQETARPDTLSEVDAWLRLQGFGRGGDYTLIEAYDGLRLTAPLIEL